MQAGGSSRSSLLEQSRQAEAAGDCISAVEKLHHHHDVQGPSGKDTVGETSILNLTSIGKINKPMAGFVLAMCLATACCQPSLRTRTPGHCCHQKHSLGDSYPLHSDMEAV